MRNYIELDGKKYHTTAKDWKPEGQVPGTLRTNLDGSLDATFGAGEYKTWKGEIKIDVTPPNVSYGTEADLIAALTKKSGIVLHDHLYPSTPEYTVYSFNWKKRSLSPMWDSPSNALFFQVVLKGA